MFIDLIICCYRKKILSICFVLIDMRSIHAVHDFIKISLSCLKNKIKNAVTENRTRAKAMATLHSTTKLLQLDWHLHFEHLYKSNYIFLSLSFLDTYLTFYNLTSLFTLQML